MIKNSRIDFDMKDTIINYGVEDEIINNDGKHQIISRIDSTSHAKKKNIDEDLSIEMSQKISEFWSLVFAGMNEGGYDAVAGISQAYTKMVNCFNYHEASIEELIHTYSKFNTTEIVIDRRELVKERRAVELKVYLLAESKLF